MPTMKAGFSAMKKVPTFNSTALLHQQNSGIDKPQKDRLDAMCDELQKLDDAMEDEEDFFSDESSPLSKRQTSQKQQQKDSFFADSNSSLSVSARSSVRKSVQEEAEAEEEDDRTSSQKREEKEMEGQTEKASLGSLPDESMDSDKKLERHEDITRQIEVLRQTNWYKNLTNNVRNNIEERMFKQDSNTLIFLERLIDMKETIFPGEPTRIPFFEKAFIKYKQHLEYEKELLTYLDKQKEMKPTNQSGFIKRTPIRGAPSGNWRNMNKDIVTKQNDSGVFISKNFDFGGKTPTRIDLSKLRCTFSKATRFVDCKESELK